MRPITKETLPLYVSTALANTGIDADACGNIALRILQSRAIRQLEPVSPPVDVVEMVVLGRTSRQATLTSGNQVNVFSLAGVLLGAVSTPPSTISAATLLVALMASCTISLSPEQAAFFIAAQSLADSATIPTASAIANAMAIELNQSGYSTASVLSIAKQLQTLGVTLKIGDAPSYVIRHSEWTISVPGF